LCRRHSKKTPPRAYRRRLNFRHPHHRADFRKRGEGRGRRKKGGRRKEREKKGEVLLLERRS
jgi:hypothetical protein